MSDRMLPLSFSKTINWIFEEYKSEKSIFGIHKSKFYYPKNNSLVKIFNEFMESPVGPAAGPHTQLTQNIIASYITGGRFFELKTVQQLDELEIGRPCIDAEDEGYNVEWSQELKLEESYDEYLKAWILLHLLKEMLGLSASDDKGFIFNMSVGYDLAGIKTPRMDKFIEDLKDSSNNPLFESYKKTLIDFLTTKGKNYDLKDIPALVSKIKNISPKLSCSVTLSTMHGCPPHEIESIVKYLITEKKLNTYVKLNPTLVGFNKVKEILFSQGFNYLDLDPASFDHDLQWKDAVPMLNRLKEVAKNNNLDFGVKLSNTLGLNNKKQKMPGEQMYMSGRSLFPVTVNLAALLAEEFKGDLNVSFSGGATLLNITEILSTGIYPVTLVTDLLKPAGYTRLKQISEKIDASGVAKSTLPTKENNSPAKPANSKGHLDIDKLKKIAKDALTNPEYSKERRDTKSMKTGDPLPTFDCYNAPCVTICPIHQDIPQYIKLVEEERYNEAFNLIVAKNPLPFITGYICDHQCQFKCTRQDYENPLLIRDLKLIAAKNGYDNYFDQYKPIGKVKDVKAAIIGSGPAGLAAGYFLAKAGFDVTVFDKSHQAGGVARFAIPEFRLPQSAVDKDVEFIKLHGVKFQLDLKEKVSVEELQDKGFKYIFLAIGAGHSNTIQLKGDQDKVQNAIKFLLAYHNNEIKSLGKTVAVIGAGSSAMDCARAAIRTPGVEKVYILYRRTKEFMPADKEEYHESVHEGVIFKELILPVEYSNGIMKCQKMQLAEAGPDGRRKVVPIEGEFEDLQIDTAVSAIGELIDTEYLRNNRIPHGNKSAHVDEETNETQVKNVFIGGDALRGPSTIIESIADGKKVAETIIKREEMEVVELNANSFFPNDSRYNTIKHRRGDILGNLRQNLRVEAERCLGCDLICNKCVEVCPNRSNVAIYTGDNGLFIDKFQILHLDSYCNDCGNCETFCPFNGAPYKEKTTLYENETEFNSGKNDGFVFLTYDDVSTIKIRYRGNTGTVKIDKDGNELDATYDFSASENYEMFYELMLAVKNNYSYYIIDQKEEQANANS
jgi:putative selenate reductase